MKQAIIGFLIVLATFTLFYVVLNTEVKENSKDIVIYILGVLNTLTAQIVNFYFGSSQGSQRKTEIMEVRGG